MKSGVQISQRPPLQSPCFTTGAFALVDVPQVVRLISNVMEKGIQIWGIQGRVPLAYMPVPAHSPTITAPLGVQGL